MVELPRGTVTFLFTDIEGSTRLWQDHRAAMEAAYVRHDTLLREAITLHGGVVYKVIGDAFQVAFPTAHQAVTAALHAQLALQGEDWAALGLPEPLRVRMAVHTGAVDPDPDGDYRSPVLNRLGRLLSAGHGGQVLLSTVTAELVRDVLPAGAGVRDLGEHRLKDLGRPERVFQVVHPALAGAFPPLVTLDIQPHNLPVQPTPLIGREREVAQLTGLLQQSDVRLVTLTGPGGTGKTRLALQAAAEVVDQFADGVWFVDLSTLTDPTLVPSAIAGVLGVREEGQPLPETLADYLRDRQVLLVLDNLEQLLPGTAAGIGALLSAAPHLTVLATSRVPLRLRAEREVAVPPLGLPRRKPPPTLAQLGQYEAVRLFIARAEAVKADFTVTSANAPAVAEICHRLDGLPLAIELAAARIRMFPPEAMLRRLQTRLTMLTGGARDLPVRQQTLRGAIAWSHELLSPDEQALFRRLSVFAGGATLEAIEAVVAADELGVEVFEGLERLVEHSLVRQTEEGGEPRFGMLETIREYGLEQLEAQGEAEEAHGRHAVYFLHLAEEAEIALKGGTEQGGWLARMEVEHDNLRAALSWALEHEDGTALRLAGALGRFWLMRGHITEGRQWLAQTREAAPEAAPAVRAKALFIAGLLTERQAQSPTDLTSALTFVEESLALRQRIGDRPGIAQCFNMLGSVAFHQGQYSQAEVLWGETLARYRELNDKHGVGLVLKNLGHVAVIRSDLAGAARHWEEALALQQEIGDKYGLSYTLGSLGNLAGMQGDYDRAVTLNEEALVLVRELGHKAGIACGVISIAALRVGQGNLAGVEANLAEAKDLAQELGNPPITIGLLITEGHWALESGDHDRAVACLEEALALSRGLGDRVSEGSALADLAEVARRQGIRWEAAGRYRQALTLMWELENKHDTRPGFRGVDMPGFRGVDNVLNALALLSQKTGRLVSAARLLGAAEKLRESLGIVPAPIERPELERANAALCEDLGEDAYAAAHAAGAALSLDEAVVEALAVAEEIANGIGTKDARLR